MVQSSSGPESNTAVPTSLTCVAPPFAFSQQAMDKALNVILIVVLFITVSLGCTMQIAKITTHLRKHKGTAIAVTAQYGIMPLTAFILGKLFQLGATESLAALTRSCCPGGNLSKVFSLALRGDMNLSIVMTTSSTEGDLEGKVPYKGTVTSLVLMLIPCVVSIILNEKKPHYTGFIIKYHQAGMVVILVSSAAITIRSVAYVASSITVVFSPSLLESFALMPFIGCLLGYVHSHDVPSLPHPLTLNHQKNRETMCMETGCQNTQFCSTILKLTFAPEIISPLHFFPLLYLLFQLGEGLLLILVFRIHARIKKQMASTASLLHFLHLPNCYKKDDFSG
uniref:Solute carrier family 10 member 1 n=1 Tax=Athene cunicularia TaxID=194338 RepID=A0A663MQJ4_ATHCN